MEIELRNWKQVSLVNVEQQNSYEASVEKHEMQKFYPTLYKLPNSKFTQEQKKNKSMKTNVNHFSEKPKKSKQEL